MNNLEREILTTEPSEEVFKLLEDPNYEGTTKSYKLKNFSIIFKIKLS